MQQRSYRVLLTRTDEGFSVSCPALPGCWSQGETREEALENIQEAIREYILAMESVQPEGEIAEVQVAV